MSFRCPLCGKWFMTKRQIGDHAEGKHGIRDFRVEGVGPSTYLETRDGTRYDPEM